MLSYRTLKILSNILISTLLIFSFSNYTIIFSIFSSLSFSYLWNTTFKIKYSLTNLGCTYNCVFISRSETFNILVLSFITIFNSNLLFRIFNTSKVLLHLIVILSCIFYSWLKVFHMLYRPFNITSYHSKHSTVSRKIFFLTWNLIVIMTSILTGNRFSNIH